MTSILSASGARALQRIASTGGVAVFDLDGTLAPIASRPSAVRIAPVTRRLLARVAQLYPTVVLTGRDADDAARIVRGVPLRAIVGNHGLDVAGAQAQRLAAAWGRTLRRSLDVTPGVIVETKRYTVAVHYRGAADRRRARRKALAAVRSLRPAPRVVAGKASLNLLPALAVGKGTALRRVLGALRARSALYVGDDATDEEAFVTGRTRAVVTVRVGQPRRTAARFTLRDQPRIDALLSRLIALRARGPAAG